MRDPPGYNNTGMYRAKYEDFEQNNDNQKFHSHENQSCVPTDLNIRRDNTSRVTLTTTTPVQTDTIITTTTVPLTTTTNNEFRGCIGGIAC